MKDNFIHVIFVIDESSSMYDSVSDVVKGFNSIIDEQKQVKDGKCAITLYTFSNKVSRQYMGVDVSEVKELRYKPNGCTAMNDGIGTAIDEVGVWLNEMNEDEKPSKNLVVIMTDGEENFSSKYTIKDVQEKIKHQEEKYNWSFMFLGADITSLKDADNYHIKYRSVTTKEDMYKNYDMINNGVRLYRGTASNCAEATMDSYLSTASVTLTTEYETKTQNKL